MNLVREALVECVVAVIRAWLPIGLRLVGEVSGHPPAVGYVQCRSLRRRHGQVPIPSWHHCLHAATIGIADDGKLLAAMHRLQLMLGHKGDVSQLIGSKVMHDRVSILVCSVLRSASLQGFEVDVGSYSLPACLRGMPKELVSSECQ